MGSAGHRGNPGIHRPQAGRALGIIHEDVKPTVVDTDSIGYTMVTGGSRTSFATGIAAIEAAESVKAQLVARAAKIWDTAEEDVEYVDGEVRHKSDPELRLGFKDLARQLATTGGTVAGQSNVDPAGEGTSSPFTGRR